MKDYEIFHINRIMSILLEQEFPANTHKEDGKSSNGSYKLKDRKEKLYWIAGSLYELDLITHEQLDNLQS